jgi:aminoglycoside phosphotransferase (APT) family kinase protein
MTDGESRITEAEYDSLVKELRRPGGYLQRRPSVESLAWVGTSMGPGSRVVGFRRLRGGVWSAVHRVTVERRGVRTFVVLRQYPGGFGLDVDLQKEIVNLGVVAGSGLPVPEALAADVAGASTGGSPSLLMTRLPGHVDLTPADPRSWMAQIAELAALMHSLDLPAKAFKPWTDPLGLEPTLRVPVDAPRRAVWEAAVAVMAQPAPTGASAFLHRDFLLANMLWSRGKLTGLTDWNGTSRGPRELDVAHCALYLAMLFSPDWSEQLRSLYESVAGVALDPWWELYALLNYGDGDGWANAIPIQVAGRCSVDLVGITARVEVAVEAALRRLG